MDKDGLLEPGDPGYAEAKARREARWASREAEQKNAIHVDNGEGVKADIVKEQTKTSPAFKSKIGKKIAETLSHAGDKAEDLRTKKNYLSSQVHRITGKTNKNKPVKQLRNQGYARIQPVKRINIRPISQISGSNRSMRDLVSGEPSRQSNTSMFINDLITGEPKRGKSTSSHINDLIGGTNSKSSSANDIIFGSNSKSGKKKGKKNDPFGGLLG